MRALCVCFLAIAAAFPASSAFARQTTSPHVCVVIDDAHDMLSAQDRRAALFLVERLFEQAGRHVTHDACDERYTLSHVRLGATIVVTLAGPAGQREGKAIGLDDLPALYKQIVRALLTGSDVGAMNVVDRTDVTSGQADVKRMQIDSFGYARLGYGATLGAGGGHQPTFGFGYRAELDTFGLDVSFFNEQLPSYNGVGSSSRGTAGSFIKLEGLYFARPRANASAYFGGGVSWGAASGPYSSTSASYSSWHGSGLQGELSVGYEMPRATDLRVFAQADATLPFYRTHGETIAYSAAHATTVATGSRYNPSIALSIGVGWQRHRQ